MAGNNSKAATPVVIPRFIYARDQYARGHGLQADSAVVKDADEELVIRSTWRGSEAAFRTAEILRPRQLAPIRQGSRGLRIHKCWSDSSKWHEGGGRLHLLPDGSLAYIMVNDVPLGIDAVDGGIERCTFPATWRYARRVAMHGAESDLRAAGILPYPDGRPWQKGVRAGPGWRAELQPDHSIVFWLLEAREENRFASVTVLPTAVRPRLADNVIVGPWAQQ